jgi:two-component system, sensor histidine kinase PdtaS
MRGELFVIDRREPSRAFQGRGRERNGRKVPDRGETLFRKVVEAAPNAMVVIGEDGRIAMVNTQAELMFGYPRAELLGHSIEMLAPERFRGHHPVLRNQYLGDPKPRPMGADRDLFGLRKCGVEFPIEIALNPIETDDGVMVLSAIVDVSDRRSKELRIEAALKEKEILLGEVHHRVKNNLQVIHSLLYLQASKINDASLSMLLKESQNRIKSMALIHQTLYESKDFDRVDFARFLDTLAPTLVASYAADPSRIALSIDARDVSLPINAAIPCGLIVNELISNALKHAFPGGRAGTICVELKSEPGQFIELSVCDDGIGLPCGFDTARSKSLGMELVWLLVEQLGAEIRFNRSDPTVFRLRFKVDS